MSAGDPGGPGWPSSFQYGYGQDMSSGQGPPGNFDPFALSAWTHAMSQGGGPPGLSDSHQSWDTHQSLRDKGHQSWDNHHRQPQRDKGHQPWDGYQSLRDKNRTAAAYALWQSQRWGATGGVAPGGTPQLPQSFPQDAYGAQEQWSWSDNAGMAAAAAGTAPGHVSKMDEGAWGAHKGSWGEAPSWPHWQQQQNGPPPGNHNVQRSRAAPAKQTSPEKAVSTKGDRPGEPVSHNYALDLLKQMKSEGTKTVAPDKDKAKEVDEAQSLAEDLTSAVALFLAGEGFSESEDEQSEKEDEEEEKPVEGGGHVDPPSDNTEAKLERPASSFSAGAAPFVPSSVVAAASAPPFVPSALANAAQSVLQPPVAPKKAGATPPRGISLADALAGHHTGGSDEASLMPSLEGMNDFLNVLRRRPLPPELLEQDKLAIYQSLVSSTVLGCYRDRLRPTQAQLQRRLRERGCSEPCVQALLPLCARDSPDFYQIQPPMRGEQPVIYLNKAPRWFEGFVEVEAAEESKPAEKSKDLLTPEVWETFEHILRDDYICLPGQPYQAAIELKRVPRFQNLSVGDLERMVRLAMGKRSLLAFFGEYLRPTRVVKILSVQRDTNRVAGIMQPGPVNPGVYVGGYANGFKAPVQPEEPQAEELAAPDQGLSAVDKDNQREGKIQKNGNPVGSGAVPVTKVPAPTLLPGGASKHDVTELLSELMLAFPHGMRFSQLQHHLKESGSVEFCENSYTCSSLPQVPEAPEVKIKAASLGPGSWQLQPPNVWQLEAGPGPGLGANSKQAKRVVQGFSVGGTQGQRNFAAAAAAAAPPNVAVRAV